MRTTRPSDVTRHQHTDPLELPGWDPDRREVERREVDRLRKWLADNALPLFFALGSGIVLLLTTMGLRMEGAPQELARFKVQAAIDHTAIVGRVDKVEGTVSQLLDDDRDLKGAVKEQRYLLCYIIRKQDSAAVGAISSCSNMRAP